MFVNIIVRCFDIFFIILLATKPTKIYTNSSDRLKTWNSDINEKSFIISNGYGPIQLTLYELARTSLFYKHKKY